MKNINIKILALFALLAMNSCSDDFIDVKSPDPNTEDFFNSEEDYQDALIAAYDMLQSTAKIYQLGEIASDNTLCGGQDALDTPGFQEIDDMIHTPVNAQLRDIWTWMYTGVNRANYIMEFKDKIDFPNKTNVLAQTRFLRGYYYFQLTKWFGDVPMAIDTRIQFGDQFEIDRTPQAQVYAQIEEDLEFAAANLPVTVNQTGRITKGAAQALLGKVYLFDKKYPESAAVLKSLIDSGTYRLLTPTEAPLMWENDQENNDESVFEIQYSDIDGGSFECFYCLEGNYAIGFNGPREYEGPVFDFGYSFNVPTQESFDAYEDGDIRRDYSILDIDQWLADNPEASYNENAGYEQTGYFNRKYIARQGDLNLPDAALTNPNNTRAIRYADVLLMYAEASANANGGPTADSYEALNQVHRRAFGLPIDTADSSDYSGLSISAFNDVILVERRLELMGEGHRFFDLVRTNKASDYIPGFQSGKHDLFPIPIQEIQLSGERWAQNPGY